MTIETYLNSLSENISTLDISSKGITSLPDLTRFRATRILNADFISFYISLMSFFLYISYYSVYFYSNLYYKHK